MTMSVEDKALGYVFGSLSPGERSQIAVERLYHSELDELITAAERDLAALNVGDAAPPKPADLWARIETGMIAETRALSGVFAEDMTAGAWVPHSAAIDMKPLWNEDAILIRCQPGGIEDAHDQPEDKDEHIIIIAGDLIIGGRRFGVGDYVRIPAGAQHSAMRSEGGCILFTEYRAPS